MSEETKVIEVNEIEAPAIAERHKPKAGVETRVRNASPAQMISILERANEKLLKTIESRRKTIAANKKKIKLYKDIVKLDSVD